MGKGHGWRFNRHLKLTGPNKHLKNRIKAIRADGLEPIVTQVYTLDEQEAFRHERELIAAIGRRDKGTGSLCNYTDGGEGSTGRIYNHSDETKAKIQKAMAGRTMTPEHRARIGAARKGHVNSPESLARAAKTRLENITPELRKKLSDAAKRALTVERQLEMSMAGARKTRGVPLSEEHRSKISNGQKGKVVSEESRRNMSAAQRKRYASNVGN